MLFLLTYIDCITVVFFPPAETWLVNWNFRCFSRMQGMNKGSSFVFIITSSRLRAVSPVVKTQKSKRKSVTHDCVRDMRATLLRSRVAGSGRRTRGRDFWPSHVTFTVMLARLLVLRSSPQVFKETRGRLQSTLRTITNLCWSAILLKKFMPVGRTKVAPHTRNVFNTEKNPNSLIHPHTFIHLVQTSQHNSPFDLMVCFFSFALTATAHKYRESHDRKENSDFLSLLQKDPFGELFSQIYFQGSSEFTFLWNLGKFEIRLNQPRWPMEFVQNCRFSTRQYRKKGTCLDFIFARFVI